jgi:hypothetical protein
MRETKFHTHTDVYWDGVTHPYARFLPVSFPGQMPEWFRTLTGLKTLAIVTDILS